VLRCDVKAFFDTVSHTLLEKQLRYHIADNDLVLLIMLCMGMGKVDKTGKWERRLESPSEKDTGVAKTEIFAPIGLPQGGILSPLLSNIYLHQLDGWMRALQTPQKEYIRYADDFVVLCQTKQDAEQIGKRIVNFLREKLQLTLGENEIRSVQEGFLFLGLWFDNKGYRLNYAKQQELAQKLRAALYIDRNTQLPCQRFLDTIANIQRYQAPTLSDEQQTWIDAQITAIVEAFLEKNEAAYKGNNATKKLPEWKTFFSKTPFLTKTYRENKQTWIADLLANKKPNTPKRELEPNIIVDKNNTIPFLETTNTPNTANSKQQTQPTPKQIKDTKRNDSSGAKPLNTHTLPQVIEINPRKLIEQKKREYEKRESTMQELVVAHAGASLGVLKGRVTVRINGKDALDNQPTANIRQITIVTHFGSLSLAFLAHCAEKKITLIVHDRNGKPQTLFQQVTMLESKIWQAQTAATTKLTGANIAKTIACAKINNQINLLKYFAKKRNISTDKPQTTTNELPTNELPTTSTENQPANTAIQKMEKAITLITALDIKTPIEKLRLQIMGHEGVAAQLYWQEFRQLLGAKTKFTHRQHQGARDLINCLLNYGYGILYGRTWSAVLSAGLHPSVSFLHTPRTDEPTLTFDLIEPFRAPIVDRAIIALISKGETLKVDAEGRLDDDTRRRLTEKVLERLNAFEHFRGERLRVADIMRLQAVHLAQFLQKEKPSFKPYSMKW
jgi:CRISPR-associated endonuclease Cas1